MVAETGQPSKPTITEILSPEEIAQEQNLARRVTTPVTLDRLLISQPERVQMIMEQRMRALENIRLGAIKQTEPHDWVLNRDRESRVTGLLGKSGAVKVRKFFGISTLNIRPDEVKVTTNPDGTVTGEIWGDGYCGLTGEWIMNVRGSRTSSEQFTGRTEKETSASKSVELSDLKEATRSNLENKVVRILAGMTAISAAELKKAWEGTDKKVDDCRKGHGYGKSDERGPGATIEAVATLIDAIAEAKQLDRGELLKKATAYKDKSGKFGYARSLDDLRYGWQIERALKSLQMAYPDVAATMAATQAPQGDPVEPAAAQA